MLRGKSQKLRCRTRLAKARFLKGRLVRAVWCEFQDERGNWKSTRLLISTDASMSAEEVIEACSVRWPIESMFNQLKLAWEPERGLAADKTNITSLGPHH